MIATLAIISGSRLIDLGIAPRQAGRWKARYEYICDEPEVFVLALELGDKITRYARIVTLADGKPPVGKAVEDGRLYGTPYRFEIGEEFCVVEILEDVFWISTIVVQVGDNRYLMTCGHLASHLPIISVYEGTLDPKLAKFIPAIKAGVERINCPCCTHRHYDGRAESQ